VAARVYKNDMIYSSWYRVNITAEHYNIKNFTRRVHNVIFRVEI
jgi:hypothetical protein